MVYQYWKPAATLLATMLGRIDHLNAEIARLTEVIERRTPIVYRRVHEFVTDNLPHDCEILALPLASDGRTINMLMSAFVWDDAAG